MCAADPPPTNLPMGQSLSCNNNNKIYRAEGIIAKTRRAQMHSILLTERPHFFFLKTSIFRRSHNIQMFGRLTKLFSLFPGSHYIRLESWTREIYIWTCTIAPIYWYNKNNSEMCFSSIRLNSIVARTTILDIMFVVQPSCNVAIAKQLETIKTNHSRQILLL